MRITTIALIYLGLCISVPGGPLTRTIGDINAFSAEVTVESTDTSQNAFDSLCARYWFINYTYDPNMDAGYDYRITIRRKASEPGTITIGFCFDRRDTLECDSLGFAPTADTVKTDTAVYDWNYLRLVKQRSGSPFVHWGNEHHMKILLKSNSANDSIVFSRPNIEIVGNKRRFSSDKINRELNNIPTGINQLTMFDIRGRKVLSPGTSSRLIIAAPRSRGTGAAPCRILLTGR